MANFMQINVFAWICMVFVDWIVGCVIGYPKIGKLHYSDKAQIKKCIIDNYKRYVIPLQGQYTKIEPSEAQ